MQPLEQKEMIVYTTKDKKTSKAVGCELYHSESGVAETKLDEYERKYSKLYWMLHD